MSLITTVNLGKSFDPIDIFHGLSLSIPHGARVALVGPNGIGKTTLLRVMAGDDSSSEGSVKHAKGLTIGFLPQESVLESKFTLWQECLIPFEDIQVMERKLAELEQQISAQEQPEDLLEEYGKLQARFEHQGGYVYETRIRQVLSGLGFSSQEYDMPVEHLSGGQRTRALLGRLLLEAPRLLILDEPTNHLDIEAVEWLENSLSKWDGAVLIVSHDRYFMDKVCNHVWEMSKTGIEEYRGNYTHYLQQRHERWNLRSKEFEAEKARLEKELEYIKRNIAAQNVSQAKGRLKRLSRQLQAIDQIGLDGMKGKKWAEISTSVRTTPSVMSVDEAHRRIKGLHNPLKKPQQLRLSLRPRKRSGNIVLRTEDLEVGYPGDPLFTTPDIELRRLDRIALIGPNGSGKTTFLKTILGNIPPLAGSVNLGASLDVGYFAQAHEDLNPAHTLIEEIESIAPHMIVAKIRSYLASYLFTGDDVYKKVSVLSGGEGGRLALSKLALSDSNLLLLDEPTNHLDILSQEVLQKVLDDFSGTIILVTHDRYLIDALGTQIWEIKKNGKRLTVFKGTYSQYKAAGDLEQKDTLIIPDNGKDSQTSEKDARQIQKRIQAERRKRKARLAVVEREINKLEYRLAELSLQLETPPDNLEAVKTLGDEYVHAQKELDALMKEWEQLNEA
jgi:ATP-binding cassette subfamily F protein 3